ncbi:conidiation-specific protein (con-13) [Cercophora scortea]|uniref:Conidiation-specific protein (Con-13) n=1 Tax=Cercophora scortea TaxID=314031 RepID=A0AAE0INC5_9PEZI|nr:conidiation-specific protein (con-13) [Cercophora scortea]
MQSPLFKLLVSLTLSGAALAQDGPPESYAEAFPDGLDALDTYSGGLNSLRYPRYAKTKWPWGKVPQYCYDDATGDTPDYCDVYHIEVYEIAYSDCASPTYVCRCNNSPMSIDTIARQYGKLPVKARQWNRYVTSYNGSECSAYSVTTDLSFFGNCQGKQSVFFHELTHNLDRWVAGADLDASYSDTSDWADVISQDTCVTDGYAKSSWGEDYAQTGVVAAFDLKVASVNTLDVDCMSNQINKVEDQLSGVLTGTGSCDRAWALSPTVCMGDEAGAACDDLRRDTKERAGTVASSVDVVPVPALSGEILEKVNGRKIEAAKKAGF